MGKKKKLFSGILRGAEMSARGIWKASAYLNEQENKRQQMLLRTELEKKKRREKDPYEGLY